MGVLPPGLERLEGEINHSHPSSTEVKKGGGILPLPHESSWHSAQLIYQQMYFTFYLSLDLSIITI
jgi:hypothetical protein